MRVTTKDICHSCQFALGISKKVEDTPCFTGLVHCKVETSLTRARLNRWVQLQRRLLHILLKINLRMIIFTSKTFCFGPRMDTVMLGTQSGVSFYWKLWAAKCAFNYHYVTHKHALALNHVVVCLCYFLFFDIFFLFFLAQEQFAACCLQCAWSTWNSSYRTWQGLGDCGGVVCQGHQWSQRCGGRAH